jgi:uncharacterized transporter YbjL
MGINLKTEAAMLEALLSGTTTPKAGNLTYRKFNGRAYRVEEAGGESVGAVENRIGNRAVIERIVRNGSPIEPERPLVLERGDEIVVAGPSAVIVGAGAHIGPEIDGTEMLHDVAGEVLDVLVDAKGLHGRTIRDVAERVSDDAQGVFLRDLKRRGQEVPLMLETRVYLGDIMTLVGSVGDVERTASNVGQVLRHRLSRGRHRRRLAGWPGQLPGGILCDRARRRRRCTDCGPRLRMAAHPPADRRLLSAGRAANAE